MEKYLRYSLLLAANMIAALPCFGLDESALRDPRPASRLVDLTGTISAATIDSFNELADRTRSETGGELAVAVVATTDGADHRRFATRVFNRWELGDRSRNDGILIFLALTDRRVEIILGDGVDSDDQVRQSQAIVDESMKPLLRAGDTGGALLSGAEACAKRILHVSEKTAAQSFAPQTTTATTPDAEFAPEPVRRQSIVPDQPPVRVEPSVSWSAPSAPWRPGPGLLFGGAGGAGALALILRQYIRHRSRQCANCRQAMVRLSESDDNAHLEVAEQAEERVGSVDYDVWACPGCAAVAKLRYGAWFTSYSRCPSCSAKTKHSRSTTIRAATYDFGGLVQIDESCAHCAYRNSYTRSTPQLTRHTRNNHFNSGFGGSSRSSMGGGFTGGGHSSGRGGGGSW